MQFIISTVHHSSDGKQKLDCNKVIRKSGRVGTTSCISELGNSVIFMGEAFFCWSLSKH